MTMTVATKELPAVLRSALKNLGFHRSDIAVRTAEKFSAALCANDGERGFICVLNLATGDVKQERGSWGGANIFEAKIVDRDEAKRDLPVGFAVILGYEGGGRPVSASVTVHPQTMAPGLLPAASPELPLTQQAALYGVRCLKGGPHRAEHFDRAGLGVYGPENEHIKALLAAGLVAVNKAGSVSATTAGKNVDLKAARNLY